MNKLKTLGYATLATLGIATATPNYATAQSQKDEGLSFYEHVDSNNNGKVDEGETSKLARIVFEEGENIAIDSKFKSGTGNLYVVSERGEIVKTIPQQYDTGVKTSQLLEGLSKGIYTTVFQQDETGSQNGSYMAIVPKDGDKNIKFIDKSKTFENKKRFVFVCNDWNDFNKDEIPQKYEVSAAGDWKSLGWLIPKGVVPKVIFRGGSLVLKLVKYKDKSFPKFKKKIKASRDIAKKITLPILTPGFYTLNVNAGWQFIKAE